MNNSQNHIGMFKNRQVTHYENNPSKSKIAILRRAFVIFLIAIVAMMSGGCSSAKLRDLVETSGNGYEIDAKTARVVRSVSLKNNVDGVPNEGENELVLLRHGTDDEYDIAVINYSQDFMKLIEYGENQYLKLLINNGVATQPETKQKENLDVVKRLVDKYGVECFFDDDVCDEYIKLLTQDVLTVSKARNIIKSALPSVVPGYESLQQVDVMFCDNTALPEFYTFCKTELVRNSSPKHSGSKNYEIKEADIWYAYDKDFNLVDTPVKMYSYRDLEAFLLYGHVDSDSLNVPSEEEKATENDSDTSDDFKNEPETKPDTDSDANTGESEQNFYRVRKSADDSNSQIGAFLVLDNAKNLADSRKSEGYKVYDHMGRLVYEP